MIAPVISSPGTVMVCPTESQGLARKLVEEYLEKERKKNRKKIILTCVEEKVKMYEKFGFQDLGIGVSNWGGEQWHEMCISVN